MTSETDAFERFRRAYWQAVHELDVVRLQHWERSHLTLPQLRVLFQVRRTPGVTTGELSRLLGITVSTTSGLVLKLVERGVLARTASPADRRQAPLYLTDAGAELVGELSGTAREFLAHVADELGEDLAGVVDALERVGRAAAGTRAAQPAANEASAVTGALGRSGVR